MSYKKIIIFIALIMAGNGVLVAQDTTIREQRLEFYQVYKPEIERQTKKEITPTLPNIDDSKPQFHYVVPQQTLSYVYNSVPIRPLALGRQAVSQPLQNYAKLGLGNLSSFYLDAGIASIRGTDYDALFHLSHLSQKVKKYNQLSSKTEFTASGNYYLEGHKVTAGLDIKRNAFNYYGYDAGIFDYESKDLKQVFTGARLKIGAQNTQPNALNINYSPEIAFSFYNDKFGATENAVDFNIPAHYLIDSTFSVAIGLKGNLSQLKVNNISNANSYFQINPALAIQFNKSKLHIGLSPTFGKDQTYLLPDLSYTANLFKRTFKFVSGWKGELIQNTYEQLSTKNPFILNDYAIHQTKSDQVFVGFETAAGAHLSFGSTFSWRQWKNMPIFMNDYNVNLDGKNFKTVFDEQVQALSVDAFAHYQMGSNFGVSANGSWYNFYSQETYDRVYHEPLIKLGAKLDARFFEKLNVHASVDFWDRVYGLNSINESEKLPAFLDLSLGAEFEVIPNLSLFLQANNILNQKYQRWMQYDNFGFNIIGGLRFKF